MTSKQQRKDYVEPKLDEARIARLYGGITARLERSNRAPGRSGRRWTRRAWAGGLTVAAAVLLVWLGARPAIESGSAWQDAMLETASDTLSVDLVDGSRITLAAETRVAVKGSGERVQLELDHGRVTCDVQKREPTRVFSVAAHGVMVRVLGTRFSVDSQRSEDGRRVVVDVERGLVQVEPPGRPGDSVKLSGGERWSMVVTRDKRSEKKVALDPGRSTDDPDSEGSEAQDTAAREQPSKSGSSPTSKAATAPDPDPISPVTAARELLERANRARRAGNASEAAAAYAALLARYPNDARAGLAAFELGRLRMDRLGDMPGAVRALQQAIRRAPGAGFREDAMARLVRAYQAMGASDACRSAKDAYLGAYPRGVHAASVAKQCGGRRD